jgi:uncharacterized protein with HEPN domain
MSKSNEELLRHILIETQFILANFSSKSKDDVVDNEVLRRAVVRSIEIIGEATKKVDEDYKLANPHVEWKKMAGARDRLIHDYFGIDYDIVWDIVVNKIPNLDFSVRELLNG